MENQPNQPAPAPVQPAPQQPWPEQTPTPAKIQYVIAQKSLNGVGGLLAFWLVIFSLNGIAYINTFFNQLGSTMGSGISVTAVIFSPIIAIGCIASVILIALRKKIAKIASIATVGLMTLYSVINMIVVSMSNSLDTGFAVGSIVGALVFGGLVSLYFFSSKRVQQTLVN